MKSVPLLLFTFTSVFGFSLPTWKPFKVKDSSSQTPGQQESLVTLTKTAVPIRLDDAHFPSSYLLGEWISSTDSNPSFFERIHSKKHDEETRLRFNLTTEEQIPTLNFNNVIGISTVDCFDETTNVDTRSETRKIVVSFQSESALLEAIQHWPNSTKILILLGNHPPSSSATMTTSVCIPPPAALSQDNGDSSNKGGTSFVFHALQVVTRWTRQMNSPSVLLETITPKQAEIHPHYTIVLESPRVVPTPENDNKILRRSSRDDEKGTLLVKKDDGYFRNSSWSYSFNHTDVVSTTKEDGIYIGCNPCAMKGNLGIEVKIQGSLFPSKQNNRHDIHLSVSGDMDAVFNWTVSMNAQYPRTRITPALNVYWIPFSPMQVPGLVHIGPSFAVSVTSVLNMNRGSVSWNTGFRGRIPSFKANLIRLISPESNTTIPSKNETSGSWLINSDDEMIATSANNTKNEDYNGFHGLETHVSGGQTNSSLGFDIKAVFQLSFDILGQTIFSAASAGIRFKHRITMITNPDPNTNNMTCSSSSPSSSSPSSFSNNDDRNSTTTQHAPYRITSKISSGLIATIGPSGPIELGDELFQKVLYDSCK